MKRLLMITWLCTAVAATAQEASELAPESSLLPVLRPELTLPALHWDEQRPGMASPAAASWGVVLMRALQGQPDLLASVPADIEEWCPAYEAADAEQRAAFWAGLVSSLAWHESTHNPRAVGGGGLWFGLIQIAPATARYRGCQAESGRALLEPGLNLACGVRILSQNVLRDGVVSRGMRGVAAEWGPFHNSRKREEMREWVRAQEYCQAP